MNKYLLAIFLLSSSVFIAADNLSPLDLKADKSLVSTNDCGDLFDYCNSLTGDLDNDSFTFQLNVFSSDTFSSSILLPSQQDFRKNTLLEYSLIPRAPPII